MARNVALVAAALAAVALLVVAVVATVQFLPAPVVPPAGNALQPLAGELTWVYTTTSSPDRAAASIPLVMGIVGQEPVGGGTSWLLESAVGASWSSRLVLVQRGDEVWATAADGLVDGQWKRSTFAAPQLFQPPPGERQWQVDYAGGPQSWQFSGSWQQRASGQMTVLGRTADAWLVEGDLDYGGTKAREIATFVEGVGLASILSISDLSTSIRWDLAAFRRERGPIAGRYRVDADPDLTIEVTAAGVTATAENGPPQPLPDWRVDGSVVTFSAADGSGNFTWSGHHAGAGLIGTATRVGGSSAVMDFARLEDGQR